MNYEFIQGIASKAKASLIQWGVSMVQSWSTPSLANSANLFAIILWVGLEVSQANSWASSSSVR